MSNRDIIVFDFETGGRNPHTCQVTQIAALAIDGRNFRLKGEFNSEIWAETDDDKAIKKGLGPIEDGALKVTGKTREGIAQAPKPKAVWKKFCAFVDKYNWKGTSFFAPIPAGYNILGYDMIIGRDLLQALEVVIDFEYQVIKWDDVSIPMNRTKTSKNYNKELHAIFRFAMEPKIVQQATEWVSCILDASCEKAKLVDMVKKL